MTQTEKWLKKTGSFLVQNTTNFTPRLSVLPFQEENDLNTLRGGYDIFVLWNQPKTNSCQYALAPPPIGLQSCSRAQTDQTVF